MALTNVFSLLVTALRDQLPLRSRLVVIDVRSEHPGPFIVPVLDIKSVGKQVSFERKRVVGQLALDYTDELVLVVPHSEPNILIDVFFNLLVHYLLVQRFIFD